MRQRNVGSPQRVFAYLVDPELQRSDLQIVTALKDGIFVDDRRADEEEPAATSSTFTIARTKRGSWAAYKLTIVGYTLITLAYYSPSDAAERLEQYLRQNDRCGLDIGPEFSRQALAPESKEPK